MGFPNLDSQSTRSAFGAAIGPSEPVIAGEFKQGAESPESVALHSGAHALKKQQSHPSTQQNACVSSDPHRVANGVYIAVHGHFYQPPRENPYLESIERQSGAAPFHDWDERIYWECYRPNSFARILTAQGEVMGIVNNFEYLSFNIGPTLMSWLESYDPEVYERILQGDRKSCERLNGHGNAIAQVYNHMILPLANYRDKRTQIRWGKADFKQRFGRDPEGMWLSETAVDYATLEVLIEEEIRFIILSPTQVQRFRPLPTVDQPNPVWTEVGGGQIDPTRPYRCFLKAAHHLQPQDSKSLPDEDRFSQLETERHSPICQSLPYIDIFFYDGPISRDMGFEDLLSSSQKFVERLNLAVKGDRRPSQIIGVATDGETFGHHKPGTEKCLAYAFTHTLPEQEWTVTNFAHYLSLSPPTHEVELKPVTAWSCSHGVDRWQDDCGCGKTPHTHQAWRRPLRDALDWLQQQLVDIYETEGMRLLHDPWQARDDYTRVMRDRHPSTIEAFLAEHQHHPLKPEEQIDALRLLEMQRYALFMYTSCGWFFDEISRPEGVQVLCYAARALELAGEVTGLQLEPEFLQRLSLAPSNVPALQTGAEVYRQLVKSTRITPEHIAAHFAISSLFADFHPQSPTLPTAPSLSALVAADILPTLQQQKVYCYTIYTEDYQLQRLGSLTLAVGQIRLVSDITWETAHVIFTVLHLGGWDFHCCVQPFSGRLTYATLKRSLFESLHQGSAAHTILAMNHVLREPHLFSLQDLCAEERHRIMRCLSKDNLNRLNELYSQVYRTNYGILMAFYRDGLEVPRELQAAAEIALTHRILVIMQGLDKEMKNPSLCLSQSDQPYLLELEEMVPEVQQLHCQLDIPEACNILERLILRLLGQLLRETNRPRIEDSLQYLKRLLAIGTNLQLFPSLAKPQELFYAHVEQLVPEQRPVHLTDIARLIKFSRQTHTQ